ncbi:COP1-interactive protein 1-like [Gossypium raimondii]|uniref:COP1-interactive protein 1-like n=1 Tax=Gossypium raimondii TaxID=29730 RepID=UPI00227ABA9C|nr:COP1-interactive protein 1-like [Gossypium raimondii]
MVLLEPKPKRAEVQMYERTSYSYEQDFPPLEEFSKKEYLDAPKIPSKLQADVEGRQVEDYSSVSKECLKEGDSKEQVEAKNLEFEDHSIKDQEASVIVESEDRRQDQESGNPVSTGTKDAELEEKIKDIVDESKHDCQDKSHKIVTEVGVETSLNNTKVNEELVNLSSLKMSLETCESDANQETKEVENPQHELEKTESALEPEVNEVEQAKAVPETSSECLSQSVQTSTTTLASEQEIETTQLSEKIEEQIQEEEETEPKVVSVEETIVDQGLQNEEPKDQIQTTSLTLPSKDELSDAKQTTEICLEKEKVDELGDGKKAETGVACAIQVEEPNDQIQASALPDAVVGQETIVAQASITEEPTKLETKEDDKIMETEVKEDEKPELPVKDGLGEDELKGKLIEDKALETIQTEKHVVEAQKMSENEIAEKQIVCEDKTVGNPAQASIAKIETATRLKEVVTEKAAPGQDCFSHIEQREKGIQSLKDHMKTLEETGKLPIPQLAKNGIELFPSVRQLDKPRSSGNVRIEFPPPEENKKSASPESTSVSEDSEISTCFEEEQEIMTTVKTEVKIDEMSEDEATKTGEPSIASSTLDVSVSKIVFTLDDIPTNKWPERLQEFHPWLESRRLTEESHYNILMEFVSRFTGMLKDCLKQAVVASIQEPLQVAINQNLYRQNRNILNLTMGEIQQETYIALEDLCNRRKVFKDYLHGDKRLDKACDDSHLKIKCGKDKSCYCPTKKKRHFRKMKKFSSRPF